MSEWGFWCCRDGDGRRLPAAPHFLTSWMRFGGKMSFLTSVRRQVAHLASRSCQWSHYLSVVPLFYYFVLLIFTSEIRPQWVDWGEWLRVWSLAAVWQSALGKKWKGCSWRRCCSKNYSLCASVDRFITVCLMCQNLISWIYYFPSLWLLVFSFLGGNVVFYFWEDHPFNGHFYFCKFWLNYYFSN